MHVTILREPFWVPGWTPRAAPGSDAPRVGKKKTLLLMEKKYKEGNARQNKILTETVHFLGLSYK